VEVHLACVPLGQLLELAGTAEIARRCVDGVSAVRQLAHELEPNPSVRPRDEPARHDHPPRENIDVF
jgi:hypothetical protein